MATREVSHGGMIMSTAASAAKSRTTPPAGPLRAPPNEIGESLAGALGAEGRVGAFGGATDLAGATFAPATGTSVGGTSVTPLAGTKVSAGRSGVARVGGVNCSRCAGFSASRSAGRRCGTARFG